MDRARQLGRLRGWAAERHEALGTLFADGTCLYAEWLFLTHSIAYTRLPDLLIGLDLWTPSGGFAAVADRDARLAEAGITRPPRLFDGELETEARAISFIGLSAFADGPAEGVILRRCASDASPRLAKVVRPSFMRTGDDAWRARRPRNLVRR